MTLEESYFFFLAQAPFSEWEGLCGVRKVAYSRSEDGDSWFSLCPQSIQCLAYRSRALGNDPAMRWTRNIPRNKTCSALGRISWSLQHADTFLQVSFCKQSSLAKPGLLKHFKWDKVGEYEPLKLKGSSWYIISDKGVVADKPKILRRPENTNHTATCKAII